MDDYKEEWEDIELYVWTSLANEFFYGDKSIQWMFEKWNEK